MTTDPMCNVNKDHRIFARFLLRYDTPSLSLLLEEERHILEVVRLAYDMGSPVRQSVLRELEAIERAHAAKASLSVSLRRTKEDDN